jgi:GNAT superfamily N-acetyltransferase
MTTPRLRAAGEVTETSFQPRAVGQLLALWQQVMPDDAPDAARLRDIALLDPAFSPAGLTMLWRGDRLIGFGYAVASPATPPAPGSPRGWIAGLGVAREERGAGLGTRLVESCLRFLAGAGCHVAELGGNGERYLLPGCDPDAYPQFRALIQRCGFRLTGSTQAMARDLDGVGPAGGLPAGGRRDSGPYDYRHPDDGDIPELLRLAASFSQGWAGLVRSHLARTSDPANLWVAEGLDGLAGFAGSDLFPGCPGRFGPMGVVPAARGHGVGARLLRLSLTSMAERKDRSAWFLWGPEGESGRRMYTSAGFRVSRTFEFFKRDLQAPESGGPTKESQLKKKES